jgi:predicted permease
MQFTQQLVQNIRYALRQLRHTPGFAVTAVLTLALGVGATTAIFTLIYQVMLRPLPVQAPEQLYKLGARYDCCYNHGSLFGDWSLFSYDQYLDFRNHLSGFSSMAAVEAGQRPVGMRPQNSTEAAVPAQVQFVSGNYFSTLGVAAAQGRALQPSDDQRGTQSRVVLSYSMWQRRFGSAADTVGSTLMVNNRAMTVAGIMPPAFFGTRLDADPPEIWAPLAFEPMLTNIDAMDHPSEYWLYLIGRAEAGRKPAGIDAATTGLLQGWMRAHLETLGAGQSAAIPQQHSEWIPAATGISELRDSYASGLRLLLMIAGFLLIVCANLANLMLVRGMAHRQQTAICLALGAQRGRLIRQTLVESLVVAFAGSAVALLLSVFGARAMLAMVLAGTHSSPFSTSISLPVFGFALAVAVLAGLIFGSAPAWITSHFDPIEALRGASRTAGDRTAWPQKALVILQAALSLALLSTAGLLTLSLRALEHQNLHLATSGRLVIGINPVAANYDVTRLADLERKFDTQLRQTPGVVDLGYATYSPLSHDGWHDLTYLPGAPPPPPEFTNNYFRTTFDYVSPGYFAAVGTNVIEGRGLSESDTPTTRRVAVVNQAFVTHFLKGKPPLGAHFGLNQRDANEFEIVGVVADTKYEDPDQPQLPMVFMPMAQPAEVFEEHERVGTERVRFPKDIVVHYQGGEAEMAAALRKAIGDIDPTLPITRVDSLQTQVNSNFNEPEMLAQLTMAFGVVALLLAAVGIYGVTAYSVERRTPEVGLRMALGADRGDVLREVLKRALSQVIVGLLLGVPLALVLGRLMAAHLYNVSSYNPPILSGAFCTLLVAAVLAAIVPAKRAASIEPVEALRNE